MPKVSYLNEQSGVIEVRTITHPPFEKFKVRMLRLHFVLNRNLNMGLVSINSVVDAYWTPNGKLNLCLSDGIVFNPNAEIGVDCVDDHIDTHLHDRSDKYNPRGNRYL